MASGCAEPRTASPSVSSFALKLTLGGTIASTGSIGAYLENYGGPWNSPNDGQGYLGFHNSVSGNQAWLLINYDDDANSIQLLGIGYNNSGTLTAGETAIPEPATATALAALLAGGVAAFRRRRLAA
jgi:hypothetical protein